MKKIILKFLFFFLLLDLIISSLFLKNTHFWNNEHKKNLYWRISSKIYHHDLMPNVDVDEKWGRHEKKLITNSIGFRDIEIRKIKKINKAQHRVILMGDSFIEGTGYDYEYTLAGLLANYLGDNFEVLNSGVQSYSPSIYYHKFKHYLSLGYKFDEALIFLDVSDIYDEKFIKLDDNKQIVSPEKKEKKNPLKKNFYKFGNLLRDNFVTFNLLSALSDRIEIIKNYLKNKKKASKIFNKSFFETNSKDVVFYRMTHVDRGFWTYDEKKFNQVKNSLKQADYFLLKLFEMLNENNVKGTLIVYPWPAQILYGDSYHEPYRKIFADKNKINFVSTYKKFQSSNPKKTILDNFIQNDVHWNKAGTKLILEALIENNIFNK